MFRTTSLLFALTLTTSAVAQMQITEWQYNGDEFIEFTNVGSTAIDMTGWSFDDDSRLAGTIDLSAYGIVAPGASVILCEAPAATFAADWSLVGVGIIGDNTANLGRNDEINLYDASAMLVDRLAYGDQNFPGTIRTVDVSGWPCHGALGTNTVSAWTLASVGDSQGSFASAAGKLGNPGSYVAVDASLTSYGVGCAGAAGIPTLSATGCPTPGGRINLAVAGAAPSAPAALFLGTSRGSLPVLGCDILVAPVLATIVVPIDASGNLALTIPVTAGSTAATYTMQVFTIDVGGAAGLAATNGLEIVIR